jgi:two-component system alkaline phosphatase synthesis response regulator PhoP
MSRGKILIIEDDRDIVDLLKFNLEGEGYELFAAFDGSAGVAAAGRYLPDLIILDIMMPVLDGLEVCRTLKEDKSTAHIPIIILSARSQEMDKVLGLELGADDYVTKPFSPRELIARVRAILRRNRAKQISNKIVHGGLVIDRSKHKVVVDERISASRTISVFSRSMSNKRTSANAS